MALAKNPPGSTEHTDGFGTYTAYGKKCKECEEDLTSRNRTPSGSLYCKRCAATRARIAYHSTPKGALAKALAISKKDDPHRKYAHAMLESFLNHPTVSAINETLMEILVDYEIKARLSALNR